MKNLLMLIKCIIGCINLRVAARIVFILVPTLFWSAEGWAAGTSGTLSFAAGDDDQESLFQLYASTRREEAKIYDTANADTALKPFTAGGNVNIPTPSGTVTVGGTTASVFDGTRYYASPSFSGANSAAGTSTTRASDQFTYAAVPTVTGISPSSGPIASSFSWRIIASTSC